MVNGCFALKLGTEKWLLAASAKSFAFYVCYARKGPLGPSAGAQFRTVSGHRPIRVERSETRRGSARRAQEPEGRLAQPGGRNEMQPDQNKPPKRAEIGSQPSNPSQIAPNCSQNSQTDTECFIENKSQPKSFFCDPKVNAISLFCDLMVVFEILLACSKI